MTGTEFSGGSADIYKCFDQILRPLVRKSLKEAGMPERVADTYIKFLKNLKVSNTVAGGLGEPYGRPASIPQGGPMSMMVVAILLRPWILQMRQLAVQPRILADDLQIISTGTRHLEHFQYAFTKTHEHIADMGAKIAPHKCYVFTSEKKEREWLRKHKWRRLKKRIPVINDCRDLGAHFNVSQEARYGTTLTDRLNGAAEGTEELDYFKAPHEKRKKIFEANSSQKAPTVASSHR